MSAPNADHPPAQSEPSDGGSVTVRGDSALVNLISDLGGGSDKTVALMPNKNRRSLTPSQLLLLYRFVGLVRRIVDFPSAEAVRAGWTLGAGGGDRLEQVHRDLKVRAAVEDGLRWSRLYGGALGVMASRGSDPATPLPAGEVITAINVVDARDFTCGPLLEDPTSPGWREPEYFWVNALRVHRTRVMWFRGAARPPSEARSEAMPDDSVVEAYWDVLQRYIGTMMGGAKLAQELRETIIQLSDFDALVTSDEREAMEQRVKLMALMRGIMGATVLGANDQVHNHGNPPTGFEQLAEQMRFDIGAVEGIPQLYLFADSPSGLNTDGEAARQQLDRAIGRIQERKARPPLERLYRQVFGSDGWKLEFNPLSVPSAQEQADTRKTEAETSSIYIAAGVYGPETVAEQRFGPDGYRSELTDVPIPEDVDDAVAAAMAELDKAGAEE